MGAIAAKSSLTVLQTDVQIYFTTLQLQRDVCEMTKGWFEDGAPLGLTLGPFLQLLRLDGASGMDTEAVFRLFDTDNNQKADALEVLCSAILLAKGTVEEKLDAIFPVFDFSSSGSYSFDELNILLQSVCRGLSKACQAPQAHDEDLVAACSQMFDAHNLPYDKPITRDQVKRWVRSDVEAARFVRSLQDVVPLPVLEAELARREEAQAAAFAQLCTAGPALVDAVLRSSALRRSFGDLPDDMFGGLIGAMADGRGAVTPERFSRAAQAWNAFVVLDAAAQGALSASELRLLLRLREHEEPSEGAVDQLCEAIAQDGLVSRASWLAASLQDK